MFNIQHVMNVWNKFIRYFLEKAFNCVALHRQKNKKTHTVINQ
jgi:hypothetical protein